MIFPETEVKEATIPEEALTAQQIELETLRIMEETDRHNGMRPKLATVFGYIAAGLSVAIGGALSYRWAVHGESPDWDILLIAMYLPMHVTLAYFKIRSEDKRLMTSFASKGKISPKSGIVDALAQTLSKK